MLGLSWMGRSIGARIVALTVAALLAVIAVGGALIWRQYADLLEERKARLPQLVQTATSLLEAYHSRVKAGELGEAEAQRLALEAIRRMRYDGSNYFWVNDNEPRMVMHPIKPELDGKDLRDNKDPNGRRLFVAFVDEVRAHGEGYVDYLWPVPGKDQPEAKVSFVKGFAPWGWIIGTGVYLSEIVDPIVTKAWVSLAIAVPVLLALGALAWLVFASIVPPLRDLAAASRRIEEGDDATPVPHTTRADEIGVLASAVDERRKAGAAKRAAAHDLAAGFEAEVGQIVQSLGRSVAGLEDSAMTMSGTAELAMQRTDQVASAATHATQNVQMVAAAAEQLSASIREIAAQVTHATSMARTAVTRTEQTDKTVSELAVAAERIGDVVRLISDIAEQTNLLALNATIEAARAGEAGRGFAVVAQEVKNLATQTAKATDEIGAQIQSIQGVTKEAVRTIGGIRQSIEEISQVSMSVAAAVEEQGAATNDIARSTQLAAHGTEEVSQAVVGIRHGTEETSRASKIVRDASTELGKRTDEMQGKLQSFLHRVRGSA